MKVIKTLVRNWRLWLLLAPLLFASCVPKAKGPTATDVATTAVVLTDDALAVAIAVQPAAGFDAAVWDDRVAWLEQAADAVRNGKSVCPHVASLRAVAEGIGCAKCVDAIEVARKAIPCK
jgi:hypothetical protein